MAKYAPANASGDKPYVVTLSDWGKDRSKVVYAANPLTRGGRHLAAPEPASTSQALVGRHQKTWSLTDVV